MKVAKAENALEQTLWKLDLIAQAVRGIAHRGVSGDINNVDDETLPAEDLILNVKADLERAIDSSFTRHQAQRTAQAVGSI